MGQCYCLDNVEGRRCNRCKENKYDRQRGCVDCPDCYNLVQNASYLHLQKLDRLADILNQIERNPTVVDDDKFEQQLKYVQEEVDNLLDEGKRNTGGDERTISEKLEEIRDTQKKILGVLSEIDEYIQLAEEKGM